MSDDSSQQAAPDKGAASPRWQPGDGRPLVGQPIADIRATAAEHGWVEDPPLTFTTERAAWPLQFTVDDEDLVTAVRFSDDAVMASRVEPVMSDVVARAKAEVERLDGRDGPFCVDCQDYAVGVDTELVTELVAEVERLRGVADRLAGLADDITGDLVRARAAGEVHRIEFMRGEHHGVLVAGEMIEGTR